MTLEELRERLQFLNDTAQTIIARAEGEKRDLSAEEQTELDRTLQDFDRVKADIDRLEKIASQTEILRQSQGRQTLPAQPGQGPDTGEASGTVGLEAFPTGEPQPRRNVAGIQRPPLRVPAELMGTRTGGFRTLGELAWAVRRACTPGGNIDPRLERLATPSTYGQEGVGSDGGFAVPPDFRQAIMSKVLGEDSLLPQTDQYESSSNVFTFPKDETTPWQTSGGIQAYWEGEGALKTQSKPALQAESIRLSKIIALVPMTDELLEDAPAMDAYLRRKAPEKINFRINSAIISGDGVGKPLGILNSAATVTVAIESGPQTADTIWFPNVNKMWSQLYAPCRRRAVWLINQDVEPQLHSMAFLQSAASPVPAYLPANGLAGQPYATLFGRPVLLSEACSTIGDVGDIILADLSQYITVTKVGGGMRTETSIHLWFDYDITAFRFVLRIGGRPWWSTSISPLYGSLNRGCFVTLAAR